MVRNLSVIAILLGWFMLGAFPVLAEDPTADELTDLVDPVGVDELDVQRAFELIAGETEATEQDVSRGDVAPGELLSDPADPYPHRVRPNPQPNADFTIGDAVLAARRAAGHIVFDGLNASPVVTLDDDGVLTNDSTFAISGVVADDQSLDDCVVEIWLQDQLIAADVNVYPDGSFAALVQLQEGENSFTARAADALGRIGAFSEPATITLDTISPEIVFDSPLEGDYLNQSPTQFSGTATDLHDVVEVLVQGNAAQLIDMGSGQWLWGADVTFSGEGVHSVSATARDLAGNISEAVQISVTYDATAPAIAIDPVASPTNQSTVVIGGTASDGYGIESVSVNGETASYDSSAGTWQIEVTIEQGENTFSAQAVDLAGNTTDAGPVTIVGDFIDPVLTLLSDPFVNTSPYTWIIGISETVRIVSLNGVPDGSLQQGDSFSVPDWELAEGENTLQVVAQDTAGNLVTVDLVVTMDTVAPVIEITRVFRDGYVFLPEDGVDGVVTNAPTVIISGTVSDAVSGIEGVWVNGYEATVTDGSFQLGPLPLIPRANGVTASARDGAGNEAQHAITVHQDVEGPEISLNGFRRGAHVSSSGQFNAPELGNYDGTSSILVTGQATDLYTGTSAVTVQFDGQDLPVTTSNDYADFEFTIPQEAFNTGGLQLLRVTATDELANDNLNIQGALTGDYLLRGDIGKNGAGMGLAESVLSYFTAMVETEVEAMDGSEMIDESVSEAGISMDATGLAFCDPGSGHRYDGPSGVMNPPRCRYNCDQSVTVLMGIDNDGHVDITMVIHYLHVDMYMNSNWACWFGSEAYARARPATISLKADFVDGTDGPALVSIPGSVTVTLSDFTLELEDCDFAEWVLDLAMDAIRDAMVDAFTNEIDSILGNLGDALAAPLMEEENTSFALYIASISNDVSGLKFWLDFYGNPCPDPTAFTDKSDDETEDPDDFLPCLDPVTYPPAQDIYDSPGSLITPNPDAASRPQLVMVDQNGLARTLEVALNDDLVNYLIYSEWAQGTLEMTIDQETVGDALSLDTASFSIFIPELANPNRTDVQQIVPTGTPMIIQLHPMLPITVEGIQDPDGIRARAGDMVMSFYGDTNGDGEYETAMFDIAIELYADATLRYVASEGIPEVDKVEVELADPEVYTDLLWSAFVLNETTLRAAVPTLIDLVLPMFMSSYGSIDLPGSGMRIAELSVIDPNAEFIDMMGDLQASIYITAPNDVHSGDLPFSGIVNGLGVSANAVNASIQTFIGPVTDPATPLVEFSSITVSALPNAEGLYWEGTIAQSLLTDGENMLRVFVTDYNFLDGNNEPHVSYATMKIQYDALTGESTVLSGASEPTGGSIFDAFGDLSGCLGCQSQDTDGSLLLLTAAFALLGVFWRRRRHGVDSPWMGLLFLFLLPMLLAVGCSDSESGFIVPDGDDDSEFAGDLDIDGDLPDGDGEQEEEPLVADFTGPDIDDDPVLVLNMVQIGDETQGFNLDEGRSPEGDPDPDNGVASLGTLANGSLKDAVDKGSVILVFKLRGLTNLPAPGESGAVSLDGYMGTDLDDDYTDNFSGSEMFGIDPMSFNEDGELLIHFDRVDIWADEDGVAHLKGGPAVFTLAIPMGDEGAMISLTINETQISGIIEQSALRSGGIDLKDGLLGGVIPCSVLAQPLEALGNIAPLALLKDDVDIDLDEDGQLDKTNNTENGDGVSAGVILTGLPAYLSEESANRAPTIKLDALPDSVTEPLLSVSGVITDPDGSCEAATVSLRVREGEGVAAIVTGGEAGCTFTGDVLLALGLNTVVATVTDERGATASDSGDVTLTDDTPPVVQVTGPMGPQVTEAVQTLTGLATDNVGILGVQIVVTDGESYAVLGTELGENGEFAVEITLPKLGDNIITVQAKDLAENVSEAVIHPLELVDVDPPEITLTSVTDGVVTVSPPDELIVHRAAVTIKGTAHDIFGDDELVVEAAIGEGERVSCTYEPLLGTFTGELTLALGDNAVSIFAADPQGNEGELEVTISYVDNQLPVIQVTAPDPLVTAAAQTLRFAITDDVDTADTLSPTVSLNAAEAVAATYDATENDFYLPMVLQLGDNTIRIDVSDLSGNAAFSEGVIELQDENPPSLTVTAPENGAETMETGVEVVGTVADDIALAAVPLSITVGSESYQPVIEESGAFSQWVELELGANEITVLASDLSGLTTEILLNVTRIDPDAPSMIDLSADPQTILVQGAQSVLTVTVERNAGGPVPAGTEVQFELDPTTLGELSASSVATTDASGIVTVTFTSYDDPGAVLVTASAGDLSDSTTIQIAEPTLSELQICTDGTQSFAGAHMSVSYSGDANLMTPTADALVSSALADGFYTHATQQDAPQLLWAGTSLVATAGEIGRFSWPVDSGVPEQDEFSIDNETVSDLLGVTADGEGFSVCGLENQLGDLPPVVDIDPQPARVTDPNITLTATVQDSDLSTCVGTLSINGQEQTVDVSTGQISESVTLQPGSNSLLLSVRDTNDQVGQDSVSVFYEAPNDLPELAVTYPGTTTAEASVVVTGTISDDGPLSDVTVRVRIGSGDWVACTIDEGAGTWQSDASLALAMGVNALRAEATDGLGGTTTISLNVRRVEPVTPPVITLTAPQNGQDFNTNPVEVSGTVAEGGNPAQITLSLTLNGDTHSINWDYFNRSFSASVVLADGENVLVIRAEDFTGGYDEESVTVTFTAPDDPPTVTITSPQDGASLAAGEVQVTGIIADDRALSTLQSFAVNGVYVMLDNESGMTSTWSALVPLVEGQNVLVASATDARGNVGDDSITISNVAPPAIVLNVVQIGGAADGFNVDQIGNLGDLAVDNALTGLGSLANPILADKIVDPEDPLLMILELTGLAELPGPGDPPVVVTINGYIGVDLDADSSDNFSGTETFAIDPSSYDEETGLPMIRFKNVEIVNDFGQVRLNTYPDQPARFSLSLDTGETALDMNVEPAYIDATFASGANGVSMNESLLGGVVPAGNLAVELDLDGQMINPLEILIRDDPADPIPDVDLNDDGVLATNPETDAIPENPDGVSVGINVAGVPCLIQR